MSEQNTAQIDANIVLGHILTKPEQLSTDDLKAMQIALVETGHADFTKNQANGNFGDGTTAAVKSYLEENPHLTSRVSNAVQVEMQSKGVDEVFFNQAAVKADQPDGMEAVATILRQPYALNDEEEAVLNRLLSGAPEHSKPDYTFGPDFRANLEKYVAQNPGTVIQNTSVIEKVIDDAARLGDRSFDKEQFLENVFVESRCFMQEMDSLLDRTEVGARSTENYRAQMMLNISGFREGRPDGVVGQQDAKVIHEFENVLEAKQDSLTFSWKPETGVHDNPETASAEPSLVSAPRMTS